jgi:hypothetical protein
MRPFWAPLVAVIVSLAPPPGAWAAVPPERALFDETFEGLPGGACPTGWVPLAGEWFVAQRASGVLRQGSQDLTRDSWALAVWSNYSVLTKFQAEEGEGAWGIGVLAYLDDLGDAYRLHVGEQGVHLEKLREGEVQTLADAKTSIPRGRWYSLRLTLDAQPSGVRLRGRLWPSDAEEPREWAVQARDESAPLPGGSIGLWTGNCAARFAFAAARRYDAASDTVGDLIYGTDFVDTDQGRLPAFWRSGGGTWVRDIVDRLPVLRQMVRRAGPTYDGNAFAALGWSGYTVRAQAIAHPGPGKWGLGLVACFGARGGSYRLRLLDDKLYLVKQQPGGRVTSLAFARAEARRGRWYNLLLAAESVAGASQLHGKFWPEEATEPHNWMVSAVDADSPLVSGAPGVWSFGCAADFDNFVVRTTVLSTLNASLTPWNWPR